MAKLRFLACMQVNRITLRNTVTSEESTVNLSKEQEANESHYKDKETGAELEVIEKMPLLEWLANSYKKFGCQLEFVTNKSQVGLTLYSTCGLHKCIFAHFRFENQDGIQTA